MEQTSATIGRTQIDLAGASFARLGVDGPVPAAISAALLANGGRIAPPDEPPRLLIVSYPLLPGGGEMEAPTWREIESAAAAMAPQGGRVILLLSALAAVPMRRHVAYSADMASAAVAMRGLAMQLGPHVLVNAVGCGVVTEAGSLLSGDDQMRGHQAIAGDGRIEDIVDAVLFLCDPLNSYTTGQLLTVDGGWSVGYGRNF